MGLNDKMEEQRWNWTDGSNFNWNQWKPNSEPVSSATKDCVVAYLDGTDGWVWKEADCTATHEIICQMRQTITPDRKLPNNLEEITWILPNVSACTAGWAEAGGKCYKVYPEATALERENSRAYCRYHGNYLPIFHSWAEWDGFLQWKYKRAD